MKAAALLVRLAGRTAPGARVTRESAEITRLCGYLPLAVGMVARQLLPPPGLVGGGPGRPKHDRRRGTGWGCWTTENLSGGRRVRPVLRQDLAPDDGQRIVPPAGPCTPGADIDGYAAAALDGHQPFRGPASGPGRPCTTGTC